MRRVLFIGICFLLVTASLAQQKFSGTLETIQGEVVFMHGMEFDTAVMAVIVEDGSGIDCYYISEMSTSGGLYGCAGRSVLVTGTVEVDKADTKWIRIQAWGDAPKMNVYAVTKPKPGNQLIDAKNAAAADSLKQDEKTEERIF